MLRFKNLASGSSGNATLVEARSGLLQTRLLIDCGLGLKALQTRLDQAEVCASQIDALFITHEHADHIGCARQFALRERIPVWMSAGTHAASGALDFDGLLRRAQDGQAIDFGALQAMPFTVPHDAREPLQLSCTDGATRLGILTDLGQATPHVLKHLIQCRALLLECNHDTDLLAQSTYPPFLKQRVAGPLGHLSNQAAAEIAQALAHPGLEYLVAAHLSRKNNHPDLARLALSKAIGCEPGAVAVADQDLGSDWFQL